MQMQISSDEIKMPQEMPNETSNHMDTKANGKFKRK